MATGALRFRTPYIEELPTAQTKQAPGFAWVAVSGEDPSKNWGTTNRKRQRASGLGQSESQREALSARQQREVERKVKELNSEGFSAREVAIPTKKGGPGSGGAAVKVGKTSNTKKILGSGKVFAHYLDDEEAEIARTGGRGLGEDTAVAAAVSTQRASKTPIARRKPQQQQVQREGSSLSVSPAPMPSLLRESSSAAAIAPPLAMDVDEDDEDDEDLPPLPSQAEMDALLNAPPLTYNQARSAPPPPGAPPPRKFCEICGFWGRVKCMKCGNMVCSVLCKDAHDEHKCLKFYA